MKKRIQKRELAKADKALGGAQLSEQGAKARPHAELQWFRLMRGQNRLNEIARILVELSPKSVFNPREIFEEQKLEKESEENLKSKANEKDSSGKGKKAKPKKLSKKEQIIAANKLKKQKAAAAKDVEKLKSLGESAHSSVVLKSESGKFLLLNKILKQALRNDNVVDVLDTLWEVESLQPKLSEAETKPVLKDYAKYLSKALSMRKKVKDLFDFQLTEMSDRLPPLSLHAMRGKFRLDPWQLNVLKLVEQKQSVLLTAPTSSGKTVLSTFVCGIPGQKTLFVVPTEPLAWQVAAMLRALNLSISLVVSTLNLVPPTFDVVVGTPLALESCLTKQIGFDFDYAVYDEVHSLNTEGGDALQRLIKVMPAKCKVLALSATIGNAEDMLSWWKTLDPSITLVQHKARFINLQRHIWSLDDGDSNSKGSLQHLHPVLSLSVEYLSSENFNHNDLAFTPVDTFRLYSSMVTLLEGSEHSGLVKDLAPKDYFKANEAQRITLGNAKDYEDALKAALQKLAKVSAMLCKKVICSLAPSSDISNVKELDTEAKADAYFADHVVQKVEKSKSSVSSESLTRLILSLKDRDLLPSILFQMDSVQCQTFFDGLLTSLERMERKAHPAYYADLMEKEKKQKRAKDAASKMAKAAKQNKDDEEQENADFAVDFSVDVSAPHPDFCLAPNGKGIGVVEELEIKKALSYDLKLSQKNLDEASHPLIRGLRRGIGLYISGLPASYHRIVQSYAQSGRLGVVISDELLAYGVNMPFRAAIFYADPGAHWLTPLVHQQMAGRAGRRGLDRQGHLVYAGFGFERLQQLLRGELPDILGKLPLYASVPLQLAMNEKFDTHGEQKLTEKDLLRMCDVPLKQFLKQEHNADLLVKEENYFNVAKQWMQTLEVLKVQQIQSTYSDLIPELVWELREFLPESLALQFLVEDIISEFKDVPIQQTDADVKEQERVALIFSLFCARKKAFYFIKEKSEESALKDSVLERLYAEDEIDESCLKFIGELGEKEQDQESWLQWKHLLAQSQERIMQSDLPFKHNLMLPVSLQDPLCNMCHSAFQRNQISPTLPTPLQHELRGRLWTMGEVLRICYNVLGRASELGGLTNLLRKAFVRMRYILDETSERNWKAV